MHAPCGGPLTLNHELERLARAMRRALNPKSWPGLAPPALPCWASRPQGRLEALRRCQRAKSTDRRAAIVRWLLLLPKEGTLLPKEGSLGTSRLDGPPRRHCALASFVTK